MPVKSKPYVATYHGTSLCSSVINKMKLSPICSFRVLSYKVCGTSLCF